MIILAILILLGIIFILIVLLNKRKLTIYKTPYTILNDICDNLIIKIINIKNLEETKTINNIIDKNIRELERKIDKISINNCSKKEKILIISIASNLERLSIELNNIDINRNDYNDILNDLSYKIWNLKNKHTVNNLCKSIGNETEINNIIDSLYKLKDILNNIHEEK